MDDLAPVTEELGVSTPEQAIEVLLMFRDAEPERWRVFVRQWQEARGE